MRYGLPACVTKHGTEQVSMELSAGQRSADRLSDGPELSWIKSSLSMANGNCVEVAGLAGDLIRVRDSQNPRGSVLRFRPAEWDAFVGGIRKGEFDRR